MNPLKKYLISLTQNGNILTFSALVITLLHFDKYLPLQKKYNKTLSSQSLRKLFCGGNNLRG